MKKILIIIIMLTLNLSADYLLGNLERCASDYYYSYDSSTSIYKLYYLDSRTDNWNSTTTDIGFIDGGYDYNSSTEICSKSEILMDLGLKSDDYNFLIAFTALLTGFLTLFFMSYIVIGVAKK